MLPEKPILSAIICNYNHGQFIRESLKTLADQTYGSMEVIVIDDASTDHSVSVIRELEANYPNLRIFQNDVNIGGDASALRALDLSRGEYVYFGGADDRVLPEFCEKSMRILAEHPEAGMCCSDPAYLDALTGVLNENRQYACDKPRFFSPAQLIERQGHRPFSIAGHTAIFRKSALAGVGGLIRDLKWHSDWFAMHCIGFRFGMCYVPEPLAIKRMVPDSYGAAGNKPWPAQREVLSRMLELLKSRAYEDVAGGFKEAGMLEVFGARILRVAVDRRYREFLSRTLIRRVLGREVWERLAGITPPQVKRMYRNVRGLYR